MRKLLVIGIGAGNPEHLTIQAINAMNTVDVFFLIDKAATVGAGTDALIRLRRDICERFIANRSFRMVEIRDPERDRLPAEYTSEVADWHRQRARLFAAAIADELGPDGVGAFLVWGDPSLYDSTLRIIEQIETDDSGRAAFEYQVIPGVTSVQALAASHRTVLHGIGEPVTITTGRLLANGVADDIANVVVMLDANCTFTSIPGDAFDIFWGAYLGTPDEVIVSGRLADVRDEIVRLRRELRRTNGWIMDTYLLRRRSAQ